MNDEKYDDDSIDAAFRVRRAGQAEQVELLRLKQEVSVARRAALDDIRDRVVLPVLEEIEKTFARNDSPLEDGSFISEGDTRSGCERRFQVPGRAAGQVETLVVSAVVVRTDPSADQFRMSAQVAERREQGDVYPLDALRDGSDSEAILRTWTAQSLQRLVVERLRRRGL